VTAFGPMGREVTWVENVPYSKIVGAKPLEIRVAHGSVDDRKKANVLALFVNKSNPIDRLTVEQAARIFGAGHPKGDFTQLSQLCLKDELGKQPIHAYGARDDCGFGLYMLNYQLKGRFRRGYERMGESAEIVKALEKTSGSVTRRSASSRPSESRRARRERGAIFARNRGRQCRPLPLQPLRLFLRAPSARAAG
jgi:phosphate transport system substrate-binding protein